jgi:hypothetical protein
MSGRPRSPSFGGTWPCHFCLRARAARVERPPSNQSSSRVWYSLLVGRALSRWTRYDLIALDEVGYVPLAEVGAEFLFQVIAERAEKAAVIVTTNLPFSEWTQVIPNARLCKALIDRITDRANIIETGTESYRFRRTMEKRKGKTTDTKT